MKYLFFDIECADTSNGITKMCSFGYVLTNEYFDILESNDLIIDPQSIWSDYALKNILAHSREYYESFPSFETYYDKIKALFDKETIAFGHGVTNDVKYINDACIRYNLPFIDFKFYDGADIYKNFTNEKENESLAKVSSKFGKNFQGEKHESKQDAYLVYDYIKEICKKMGATLKELLTLVENCKGENISGMCMYNNHLSSNNKLKSKGNYEVYEYFISNVKSKGNYNKILKDKRVGISLNYEKKHFREVLLMIQLITNFGGIYVSENDSFDILVTYNEVSKSGKKNGCIKEYYADESIKQGFNIRKIDIEEFMKLIKFDDKDVIENYNRIFMEMKKNKEKVRL